MDKLIAASDYAPYFAGALIGLLLAWLVLKLLKRRTHLTLKKVFEAIAHDSLQDVLLPSAEEGEIHVEHLLLTAHGILVVDVKDVNGAVFGGDKMHDWTVINSEGRFTFANPQSALQDRIAAVRQISRDIPVTGRILFLEDAKFTKGVPAMACGLQGLLDEFGESNEDGAQVKVNAFRPHWDRIRDKAMSTRLGRLLHSN